MLNAASEMIINQGVTVSLDHLRFDEVIAAADVARTSAYRRWPTKDRFVDDLLIELASASRLGTGWGDTDELLIRTLESFKPRPTDIDPVQDRLDVLVELLRISAQADIEAVFGSADWRIHITLQATLQGLPPGDLRTSVTDNLKRAEDRFGQTRADAFRRLGQLWGFRAVDTHPEAVAFADEAYDGYTQLAFALTSTMTGFVVRATTDPTLVRPKWRLAPFGTSCHAPWSAPALALVNTILSHLDPQPPEDWGDHQLDAAIHELREIQSTVGTGRKRESGPGAPESRA